MLTQADVNSIIAGYSEQFPLPFVLVVCGYAFILLIDKVIIDSHSHGDLQGNKNNSNEEPAGESADEVADVEINSPGDDIQDALLNIQMRKKSTSVTARRESDSEDLRSPRKKSGNDKHIHNEDCHKKTKSIKLTQKELLEQSLQQHFKKTDKFAGGMKNLIDEHKREVKRMRI